jgi:hypothetical protein
MADFFDNGIKAEFPDRFEADPNAAACEIRTASRRLFAYHAWYTLEAVRAGTLSTANLSATAARLLQNQQDIGAYYAQYIGQANGNQLATLLTAHITIAVDVLTAALSGDQSALAAADARWRQNANDIAAFLNGLSPSKLDLATLQGQWSTHLDQVEGVATALIGKDYQEAVDVTDQYIAHIFAMSDYIVSGL